MSTTELPSFETARCLGPTHLQDFVLDPAQHLARSQKAAAKMDCFLGFSLQEAESQDATFVGQTWGDLSPQVWQTPYNILLEMLDLASPHLKNKVVDLGAGYGRLGLVLAKHFEHLNFVGIEAVQARVQEGLRIYGKYGVKHTLVTQDFNDPSFVLPTADTYFIYDSAQGWALRDLLQKLKDYGKDHTFQVIARGGMIRTLIDQRHPWLGEVQTPKHFPHFSIYRN